MPLPAHNLWSKMALLGAACALCAGSPAVLAGSLTVSSGTGLTSGATTFTTSVPITGSIQGGPPPVKTSHASGGMLPPFVFPGAPVAGYAGLPVILMAAQAVMATPVLVRPPSSITLSPSALGTMVYSTPLYPASAEAASTHSILPNGTDLIPSGSMITVSGAGTGTSGSTVTISGGSLTLSRTGTGTSTSVVDGNGSLTVSGAGTVGGTTITNGSGTLTLSGTNTGSTVNISSGALGLPVSGTGIPAGTTITSGIEFLSIAAPTIVSVRDNTWTNYRVFLLTPLNGPTSLTLTSSSTLPKNLSATINTADPGTAFSDANTVDSITGSASGAIFPNGTNINVTFGGTGNAVITNQTGSDLVITPSTTVTGGLLISKP